MKLWSTIADSIERHGTCAMITIADVKGSAPRERGTRMLVTEDGIFGTIGGGALEWRAIAYAQKQPAGVWQKSYILGPDLGQCCGGVVTLVTEVFNSQRLTEVQELAARELYETFTITGRCPLISFPETFGETRTRLYLLGAGHVGRALMLPLATLPFDIVWLDPRPDSFPKFTPENIVIKASPDPLSELNSIPSSSFALVMSHSHALDLAFTEAALRHPNISHLGLIGSKTKRARFVNRLRSAGLAETQIAKLACPIGIAGITSKDPATIAISTAAQLLQWREQITSATVAAGNILDLTEQH
jgi:xanthine dehydrogenase accessory factor